MRIGPLAKQKKINVVDGEKPFEFVSVFAARKGSGLENCASFVNLRAFSFL